MARLNYKEVLKGDKGTTFTPYVTQDGLLYWKNDGGLINPTPVNIQGKQGEQGEQGEIGRLTEEQEQKIDRVINDYNDAISNLTNGNESATNSEIVQARNGEVNLNSRLDKFDAQLETINRKIQIEKLDELLMKFKNKEEVTIVCYGDSVTWGYIGSGTQVTNTYPLTIQNRLRVMYDYNEITVYNEGMPGATTVKGVTEYDSKVKIKKADLVIIMFGLNDNAQGVSINDYKKNLITMIDKSIANGSYVLLMSNTPAIDGISSDFNQKSFNYSKVCSTVSYEKHIDFLDLNTIMNKYIKEGVIDTRLYDENTLHFTDEGYKFIGDIIVSEILNINDFSKFENGDRIPFKSQFVQNNVKTVLNKPNNLFEKSYFLTPTNPNEKIAISIFNKYKGGTLNLLTTRDNVGGSFEVTNFAESIGIFNTNGTPFEDYKITIPLQYGLNFIELKGSNVESGKYLITSGCIINDYYRILELQNSWVNSGVVSTFNFREASCAKDGNIIYLGGLIKNGAVSVNTVITTLPIGYRPKKDIIVAVSSNDGSSNKLSHLKISSNGNVSVFGSEVSNSYLSLEGISFII